MAERKVLNKYMDPNFNHEKLVKLKKPVEKQDNVRNMLPFSIRCDTCGNYLRIGTKINMRKETVVGENYLGIPIYRFYMKCVFCYTEMTMKTDPKNHDYAMELGAVRLYESWKDARAAEELLTKIRKNEEEGDNMKFMEYKTYDSKKEMDTLEAIDEIRIMSRGNAKLTTETVVDALNKRDYYLNDTELKDYVDKIVGVEETKTAKKFIKRDFINLVTKNILKKCAVSEENTFDGKSDACSKSAELENAEHQNKNGNVNCYKSISKDQLEDTHLERNILTENETQEYQLVD